MSKPPKRVLLVEGAEDLRVFPWLLEQSGVPWGATKDPIVKIVQYEGATNLLSEGEIETQLKASGLLALGVIVDADENAAGRWQAIRARISEHFPSAPSALPLEGLVMQQESGPSFGAWVMPDNVSRGILETFLLYLRPSENQALHAHAESAVSQAQTVGAPFRDPHRDKALIHTWLAWQDPPGRQMHQAIMAGMLRESSPALTAFVSWFCKLYSLSTTAGEPT
jgi:hypothetical protein